MSEDYLKKFYKALNLAGWIVLMFILGVVIYLIVYKVALANAYNFKICKITGDYITCVKAKRIVKKVDNCIIYERGVDIEMICAQKFIFLDKNNKIIEK